MKRLTTSMGLFVGLGLWYAAPHTSASQTATRGEWKPVTSNDGTYQLSWKSEPESIEFGAPFKLHVQASRVDGSPLSATLALDARMPEHGHGMNREPRITVLGEGRFEVEGLLFHMPGYWELYFDLTRGALTERAQAALEID